MIESKCISIPVRKYDYKTWADIVVWCHANLCVGKDFKYAEDHGLNKFGNYMRPSHIWFRSEEDLVALKLSVNLK